MQSNRIKETWPLIGVTVLIAWQWIRRSPEAHPKPVSEPIAIDKSEMDLSIHNMTIESPALHTNKEWYCPLSTERKTLEPVRGAKAALASLKRPVRITAGTDIVATGQVSSVYYTHNNEIAGYSILFDSAETVQAMERKLEIQHPKLGNVSGEPVIIDKREIDLASILKSRTPDANTEWNCDLLSKSEPLDVDRSSRRSREAWLRPVKIVDGTELLAKGQVRGLRWDAQMRFAGYVIAFESATAVKELESKLGLHRMGPPSENRHASE